MYLNKVMLIGNVGKDPEIKTTQSGRRVASFPLATSRAYRDKSGEKQEETQWHKIVMWGKVAETLEKCGVKKGDPLYIEGNVSYRSWDAPDGSKRYATDIVAIVFQCLRGRSAEPTAAKFAQEDDEELPF